MQSCCFGFEQHLGRWAVFAAAFHHAERAPRVTSSLTAESPTIRSFKTSLVSIQGFSPPVSCAQGRLVKRRLDSPKAKRQQQDRRKASLVKKAYKYSLECDADVYMSIRIKKTGRVFTCNSCLTGKWLLSEG